MPRHHDDEEHAYDDENGIEEAYSIYEHGYENWVSLYSTELHAMWFAVKDKAESMGAYVLDDCSYADFEDFCYQRSSGKKPPSF